MHIYEYLGHVFWLTNLLFLGFRIFCLAIAIKVFIQFTLCTRTQENFVISEKMTVGEVRLGHNF